MQTNRAPPIKGLTSSNFPGRKKKKSLLLGMEIRGGKKGEGLAGNWIHARTHGRGTSLRDHRVAHSSSPGDHISSCTDYCKRWLSLVKPSLRPITSSSSRRFSTLLLLPISISDRLAPTSQECDTSRNSFELHISLAPREITAAAVKLAMWIHGAREYLKIR